MDFNTIWLCYMSVIHWLNILSTPIAIIWANKFVSPNYFLWVIEVTFLIDILRKCFIKKPKSVASDVYEVFVEYVQSNLILDLISVLPQVLSGLDSKYLWFKIVRIYEIDMLHFALSKIMRRIYHIQSDSEKNDKEYAFGVISKILVILHCLSCLWIHVGSESYLDSEEGYLPWQYANDDFDGYNNY